MLFGTFGMSTTEVNTPTNFYSQELGFRATSGWAEVRNSKKSAAEKRHELKQLREEFTSTSPDNSWDEWVIAQQMGAVRKGIERMFAGKGWVKDSEKHGVIGRATSIEITLTPSQNPKARWWRTKANIHTHFLIFLDRPFAGGDDDEKALLELKKSLHRRWNNALKTFGFHSTLPNQQLVVARTGETDRRRIASYLPKGSLTIATREPDAGSLDLFAPLRESMESVNENGDIVPPSAGALMMWKNLEASLLGVHLFRITPSLKQKYNLPAFRNQQKQSRKMNVLRQETVAVIAPEDWARLREEAPEAPALLKDLASNPDGGEEVRDLLTALDIPFIYQGAEQ